MRLGIRAVPHTDAEMQVVSATLLTPADAAVAISHSGESQAVLRALMTARLSGAQTVSITNHPASSIAKVAQVNLYTAAQEALAYGYPLGARVAQVGLVDVLYSYMALKRQSEVEQNHARIVTALQQRPG
jgi:DNA-binding MurR/RpiR family transcriptional regulator